MQQTMTPDSRAPLYVPINPGLDCMVFHLLSVDYKYETNLPLLL